MTIAEPIYHPDDPFGPSKPVTSYTELIEAIRDQVGVLGVKYDDFDVLAGFPVRLSGKVFGPCQVKRLGPEKLFDAMRAAGLRLRVEVDPEQTAKMQARIKKKLMHPRQANQARYGNHASTVSSHVLRRAFKHISRLGSKKRWAKTSKVKRSAHASMMANARWKKKRRADKAKRQGAAHRAVNAENATA